MRSLRWPLRRLLREVATLRHRVVGLQPASAVLLYHHVLPELGPDPSATRVSAARFVEHLEYLTTRYDVQPLGRVVDDLLDGRRPERPRVAISFDDGFA